MDERPLGRLTTSLIFAAGFGMVATVIGISSWLLDGERPQPRILPVTVRYAAPTDAEPVL